MDSLATLTPKLNSNARRVKRLVEVGSVRSVAYALGISEEAVRLAVRIADELEGAEAMWEIHSEGSNR